MYKPGMMSSRIALAPPGEGEGGTPDPTLTNESMTEFMNGLKELGGDIKELNGHVREGRQRQQTPTPENNPNEEDGTIDSSTIDFESMSRRELVEFIQNSTLTAVEKRGLAPLVDRINTLEAGLTTKEFSGEIDVLAKQHKDFWDFRGEMKSLAERHPSMRPEEVYLLARATHPEKAKELDTKYAPVTESRPKPRSFGGFTPGGNGSKGTPSKAMSTGAALEDAWAQVNAKHGDILSSLEN